MNTQRSFLIGFGAGLLLTVGGVLAADDKGAVAASPSDAVRGYLAARARHDSAAQYVLLSAKDRAGIPFTQFNTAFAGDKTRLSHAAEDGVSPLLASVSVFFMDAQELSGYAFAVVGPDPGDPQLVLVRAQPPGVAPGKAFLIKIVTTRDAGGAARLDMLPSYGKTSAHDSALMQDHAKGLTSLSNLRQIGLALIQYAQAHGDRLPDADGWVDALLPQWAAFDKDFPAERLFRDPSAPAGQPWNYAFNRALSGVRLGDIKDPAATVMVFESTAGAKNAADTGQSVPHPGRHAGGDYYVFADGRAKWFRDGTKLSYKLSGK